MPIDYVVLRKSQVRSPATFAQVESLAIRLLDFLRKPDIEKSIAEVHKVGASSADVQAIVLPCAKELGFTSERRGLFSQYAVAALRPDYYAKVGDSGVLLEVERGKTTTNNMDFLDFWKCHICDQVDYLFLLVPQARPSKKGPVLRHYNQVQRRLGTFFVPRNYVNVEAVFLYGY